jgi:protein-disulfide isomerase
MKDESEIVRLSRPVNDQDHVLGPQSAPVTLVEYGDYECPYCRQLHPIIHEIMERAEGLRFIYRHFPISKLHPHAARAAEGAEAASAQGRFWEMHNLLFEKEQPLDDERLARLAGKAGLDMERYTREMREGVYAARVEKDFKAALYGDAVTGTPTLYLNSVRLSNIQSIEVLLVAVIEAGAVLKTDFNQQATWRSRLRRLRVGMTHLHSDSKT